MLKRVIVASSLGIINCAAFADANLTGDSLKLDESQVAETEDYINRHAFLQNPYQEMVSGGGHAPVGDDASIASRLFSGGSWNAFAAASYMNMNGASNYGYGLNLFGQTGQIAGFSVGGLFTAMNPWFSDKLNPSDPEAQAQTLPIAYQVNPQQLFLEYQYSNILQVDVGYIGINNSPWLTYYENNALNMVTYQGALVNINPGAGFLITALAFNQAQLLGENGFSRQTMYNTGFDYGTQTANITDQPSEGTIALGTSWTNSSGNLNARLWGYQFYNYSRLLYADSTLKLPVNSDLDFSIGVQGALQGDSSGENLLIKNGYGNSVRSNMLGLQLAMNYSILGLELGYNNVWGPSDGYEGGALVSPYTYQLASDPLYTTGWMLGLVEKSAGQAYKVAPSLNLLDGNLVISPSYQYYATTAIPSSTELDFTVSYSLPQVKGLTFFGGYGYALQDETAGGNVYQWQLMASYLY